MCHVIETRHCGCDSGRNKRATGGIITRVKKDQGGRNVPRHRGCDSEITPPNSHTHNTHTNVSFISICALPSPTLTCFLYFHLCPCPCSSSSASSLLFLAAKCPSSSPFHHSALHSSPHIITSVLEDMSHNKTFRPATEINTKKNKER